METTHARTPDWLLERIALSELPPDLLARARARLLAEPDGAARLAALEQSNRDTLAALPRENVTAEVQRRLHLERTRALHGTGTRARQLTPLWLGLPAAAVVAMLVWLGTGDTRTPRTDTSPEVAALNDGERIKGDARLVIHRRTAGAPERLTSSARARRGDVLQLGYVAAGQAYGAIVSVDGRGTVTFHLPERGEQAAPLQGRRDGAAVALPSAYELDDAPAFERFFLVTSEQPFAVEAVQQAAEQLATSGTARTAPLALPSGLNQAAVLVEKPSP
ncbi:MAG: ActD-like protein [Myxococcaceae bacterium]|nr:ActD-like protein [Myxococcaceae bacterium]MCI0668920.1 ActD-like protein [Myxococcaceae bacterium]